MGNILFGRIQFVVKIVNYQRPVTTVRTYLILGPAQMGSPQNADFIFEKGIIAFDTKVETVQANMQRGVAFKSTRIAQHIIGRLKISKTFDRALQRAVPS